MARIFIIRYLQLLGGALIAWRHVPDAVRDVLPHRDDAWRLFWAVFAPILGPFIIPFIVVGEYRAAKRIKRRKKEMRENIHRNGPGTWSG